MTTTPRVFAAVCYDRCQEDWVVQKLFLCKNEAVDYAYEKTQTAVRCNRPLEWWRVEQHQLAPCSDEGIIWGAHHVTTSEPCR